MATKINIAQLDIDIDGLKGSMVEAKRELDRLVESNREMRKAGDSANETYIEQDAAIKRLRAEYNSQARVLNQAIVAIEGADKAYNAQIKTVSQAEQANKVLRQAIKHLDTTTLAGIQTAELYNIRIEENTAFMKDNVDEQIQGYMSVGEYSKGIQDAAKELSPFNMLLKGMNGGFKEAGGILPFVTQSLKGVVGGIRAATTASLAFIATPIGAVIAAIGIVLALVINYLKNTESGMDKVMSVLTPLNEILKVFWQLLEDVGKALVDAFSNPGESVKALGNLIGKVLVGYVKTAMRYFTNLGKIMLGAVTFDKSMIKEGWDDMKKLGLETAEAIADGYEKVKDKIGEVGDKLSEANDRGREMHRLTIEIREETEALAKSESDYKDELLKQEAIYKDRSKTAKERLDASEQMKKIQQERIDQTVELLTKERDLHALQIKAGEDGHEDRMKQIELNKRIDDQRRKANEYEVSQLNRINNIHERGERDRQKALQAQKKLQEDILRLKESERNLDNAQAEVERYFTDKRYNAERKIAEDASRSYEERKKAFELWSKYYDGQLTNAEETYKVEKEALENEVAGLKEVKALEEEKIKRLNEEVAATNDHNKAQLKGLDDFMEKHKENRKTINDNIAKLEEALKDTNATWAQRARWEEQLEEQNGHLEYQNKLTRQHKEMTALTNKTIEENIALNKERTKAIESSEESITEINNALADKRREEIDFDKIRTAQIEAESKLREELAKEELEDIKALREAKLQMFLETTKLQMESEKERLDYEREIRKLNLEDELDEEKAFLLSKMELLNSTEEEKTETLLRHEELRRELLSDLEEQWREEDKQHIEDYEAYKRGMARETTDLVLDQIGRESTAGKILSAFKKGLALQEWVIQKKKAAADMALAKASATGELAKGQARTASSAPFPLNIPLILGFVAQAAGILSMFKQPKVKDPKFARGTILGGSRHFEGGVKTPFGEVEGGEMLLTRGVTFDPILRSMASQLNMMGGGDNLDTGSSVGSIGSPKGFIDYDTLAAKVAQANRHLPSPLVRVSDIDRVQNSVMVTDNLTTF